MLRKTFFIGILIVIILGGCTQISQVCFEDKCFDAEVVSTPEARATGLMFRENLELSSGMLFVFNEEKIYPFWMKNTLIPLDMIWINSNNEVVYIAKNVQPCKADPCPSVTPTEKSLYVFEVNAGVTDAKGIFVGDTVSLPEI